MYKIALFVFLSGISIAAVSYGKGIYAKIVEHEDKKALDCLEYGFYTFIAIFAFCFIVWTH